MTDDATEMPGSEPGKATCAKNAQVQPASADDHGRAIWDKMQAEHDEQLSKHGMFQASAAMPSEEDVARAIASFRKHLRPDSKLPDILPSEMAQARAVLALFAPILAEKERVERAPYSIGEPEGGWRNHGSFSREEKAKLRPVAETLAMLDGNAFFGNEVSAGAEWYEQYLPEAHALYEGNGGDSGWAGEASFARPESRALAAEAALAAERKAAFEAGYRASTEHTNAWFNCVPHDSKAQAFEAYAADAAAIRAQE